MSADLPHTTVPVLSACHQPLPGEERHLFHRSGTKHSLFKRHGRCRWGGRQEINQEAELANIIVFSCRYHSAETLRLMGAYRIGRVHQPWANFTPPIRGGVFRKYQDEEESISSEDDEGLSFCSHLASLNSSTTSLELAPEEDSKSSSAPLIPSITNKSAGIYGNGSSDDDASYRRAFKSKTDADVYSGLKDTKTRSSSVHVSRIAYVTKTIQTEVDNDLRDYPSLDEETQRNITLKYQALHQLVKDGGFYDCRYSEYGKEAIRYSLLFATFLVTLHYGWYMTSACFLGLFWVCAIDS